MSAPWMDVVAKEVGVVEPEAEKYFEATDYGTPDASTPYCAAFVNWVLAQVGIRGSGHANAVSFANWGDDVSDTQPVGAIVVFEWSSGGHHVTFYAGDDQFTGGNQTKAHEVCTETLPLDAAIAWRWPSG